MKNSKAGVFLLSLLFLASCSPAIPVASETATKILDALIPSTSTPTLFPSQTPLPSLTSTQIASSATPTPDYSKILLYGTDESYGSYTLVILEMGILSGEFYGMGNGEKYSCQYSKTSPTQLNCFGPGVAYQQKVDFSLYLISLPEPVFNTTFRFSGPPPTPMGMYCEIEPLWTEVLHHIGGVGCYAVTCWVDGKYYGGVQDSCKEYWPWIPPGLFPTPLPTP